MAEHAPFLPGLSPVQGKPVHVTFDGGRLSSDAGVPVLAEIERRLRLAEHRQGAVTTGDRGGAGAAGFRQRQGGEVRGCPGGAADRVSATGETRLAPLSAG